MLFTHYGSSESNQVLCFCCKLQNLSQQSLISETFVPKGCKRILWKWPLENIAKITKTRTYFSMSKEKKRKHILLKTPFCVLICVVIY